MIIKLKIRRPGDGEFIVCVLSHIVGHGNYAKDELDPCRWKIEPVSNDWFARTEDGVLSVNGRYATKEAMSAVKQMLLFRCDVEEIEETEAAG